VEAKPNVERPQIRPDVLAQMISDYEDELTTLTNNPEGLDKEEQDIEDNLETLTASLRSMERRITETSKERKGVYDVFTRLTARSDEIAELQQRFRLLDAQYTNDVRRLLAIEESGQLFVLRDPMACPLCGAAPEGQHHDAACDGNVTAVTQAASAEIAKIKLLQKELYATVEALTREHIGIGTEREKLRGELSGYQQQIETALSPDFAEARQRHTDLIERRSKVQQAAVLHKRILALRRRLDEPSLSEKEKPEETQEVGDVDA
jgi:chromosome segregation ATPase